MSKMDTPEEVEKISASNSNNVSLRKNRSVKKEVLLSRKNGDTLVVKVASKENCKMKSLKKVLLNIVVNLL